MFRIHLPAFMTMLLITGLLLRANVVKSEPLLITYSGDFEKMVDFDWGVFRGWPFQYETLESDKVSMRHLQLAAEPGNDLLKHLKLPVDQNGRKVILNPYEMKYAYTGGWEAIAINIIIALFIICPTTTIVEFFSRRFIYHKTKS